MVFDANSFLSGFNLHVFGGGRHPKILVLTEALVFAEFH